MKRTGVYLTDEQIAETVKRFRYVRNKSNCPIGVVVLDKKGRVGWSLYNTDHEEELASTDKGLLIALNRATTFVKAKKDLQKRLTKMAEYKHTNDSRLKEVFMDILVMQQEILKGKRDDRRNSVRRT